MESRSRSSDAPGLLAATDFQFLRALRWLACTPSGSYVGLETGDDVVIQGPSGHTILEQDKSSLKTIGHPFTDRSEALWKTLALWADKESRGELEEETVLLLVTNRRVPNCLARRIGHARDSTAVNACVDELWTVLSDPPSTIKSYCKKLEKIPRPTISRLLTRIKLCDGAEFHVDDLIDALSSELHFPPSLKDPKLVVFTLSGWLHTVCLEKWHRGERAWVKSDQFNAQYHAVLDQIRRERTLERAAILIPLDPLDIEQVRTRVFVSQLLMVAAEDPDIDEAIACYLRFNSERLRLTEIGDITERDWTTFFDNLQQRWRRIVRLNRTSSKTSKAEVGQQILRDTVDQGYLAHLAGQQTSAEYFTSGGYHRLADDKEVWWHPNFREADACG